MKRALKFAVLFLGLLTAGIAQEQKPAEETPSIDQILQKMVDAAGGKAVLEKMTTRTYKGTFEMPAMGGTGTWERYEKAPGKLYQQTEVAGFGTVVDVCDGETAWSQNPMAGFTEKSGASLADAKLDAEFQRELRLKELFPKMTSPKKDKVATRDVWVFEAAPPEGTAVKFYVDVENGLLVRQDTERDGPQGRVSVSTYFEDYKDVDGYKLPFTMRMEFGEFGMILKITEFKTNVEIDDAKFAKPAVK